MLDRLRKLFQWIVNRDLAVLIATTILVVAAYVLVETIDEVTEGDSHTVDTLIMRWVASLKIDGSLQEAIRDLTALGGVTVVSLAAVCVMAYLVVSRRWHAAVLLLLNTLGAVVVSMALKGFFDRKRPDFFEHGSHTITSSFPSGHSMLSTTMYLTLAVLLARLEKSHWLRVYFICVALALAGLVGISRVLLGVHWPTDVLAGWAAGVVWATVGWFVVRWLQRRGAVERPASLEKTGETRGFEPVIGSSSGQART